MPALQWATPKSVRTPQAAAMPNATRKASPTIRPVVSLLLQPSTPQRAKPARCGDPGWSTATVQTANRTRAATARILIHMMSVMWAAIFAVAGWRGVPEWEPDFTTEDTPRLRSGQAPDAEETKQNWGPGLPSKIPTLSLELRERQGWGNLYYEHPTIFVSLGRLHQ